LQIRIFMLFLVWLRSDLIEESGNKTASISAIPDERQNRNKNLCVT
jgi:hypothetical protein